MTPSHRRPFPDTTFGILREVAAADPDREAYVEHTPGPPAPAPPLSSSAPGPPSSPPAGVGPTTRRSLTFGEWFEAARTVAALFHDLGLDKGDVVALLLPSSIDYAVCYAAALRLGAVTTGVNPRLGPAEKSSILARSRPTLVVVDDAGGPGPADGPGSAEGPGIGAISLAPGGSPATAVLERAAITTLVADGPGSLGASTLRLLEKLPLPDDPTDPVAIVWTSGTTGAPKGALFDHRCLRAVAAGTDVLSSRGDRRLNPLPFAHVGYMTRLWDEIEHRITTVITPSPWTAASTIELIEIEGVTVAQGVPTQWALVLAHPGLQSADVSSLRIAATGASPAAPELVRAMRERLGCPVVVRYTCTEGSLGTGTRPGDSDDVVATSVGRPVPGVELELCDPDGRPVVTGEIGRVRVRSAARMLGYLAARGDVANVATSDAASDATSDAASTSAPPVEIDHEATASVIDEDGWVVTGDLGWLDPAGNLRLAGRATDMIIRGGYNVYPLEVETVLGAHPAVAAAAVVGSPDPVLGEVVCAAIVAADAAAPTLAEMRAWVAGQLADYKAPDRVAVLESMPLTAMGKVDKRAISAQFARTGTRS